jgi:sugar phosphate isomerase/epimerase
MNRRSARIRIGNQTAFSASSVMLPFEYAVANGFDAFEWFPDKKESGAGWTVSDISDEMRDFIRNTAQTRDIILSVHAPWQVNPLLSQGGEHLFECVRFAKDIGASLVNVHLVGDMGIEAYLRALFPWLQILVEAGIRLSIENTPRTCPREFNELFLKLPKLFPDLAGWVGLCLDLGHANLCEETRNDYLKFMDLLQPHVPVIHIHAHENYGDNDSHLTLFTGPAVSDPTGITGFVKRLGQRQFAGCIILEQWPEPPSLLNNARNNLIDIIENCAVVRSNADAPSFPRKLESSKTHDSWIPAVAPDPDPGFAGMTKDRKMPILGLPPTAPSETASRASFPRRRESRGLHIVDLIAQADRDSKSWRQKLIFMHNFITDEAHELRTEHLVYLAIYLRFIAGGQIASNEDGSHYRPSHHAKMAQAIHDRLSKMAGPDNVLILRKIYPLLPSYDSIFTSGEPLTRIRDIAHRNDIPKELKQEIKHTLQNKLHRCAGPEDLVTSGRLLDRIIAHEADLSPEFVLEFRRFHDELKEFFNARSLEEQLEAVCEKAGGPEADLIQQFLVSKKEGNKPAGLLTTMDLLIALRTSLGRWAGNTSSAEMQGIDLADILLEDYSFVLLSRIINHIEAQKKTPWGFALSVR